MDDDRGRKPIADPEALARIEAENRTAIDKMRSNAAAQSRAGNSPVPWGALSQGPAPAGMKRFVTEEGIDRTEFVWRDRQRFRDGSGPAKMLFGHDPYAETPPHDDGRAIATFHLSTDAGMHPLQMGTAIDVRVGAEIVVFLTTEPCVVRPEMDTIVGGRARNPGSVGNLDIHMPAGIAGLPAVRVDNPFPGMGGADVTSDGTLLVRRPHRPKTDRLLGEEAPETTSDRDAASARLTNANRPVVWRLHVARLL